MANAKFIDAATWASLPEIDVTNGEDLFPQLAAGTYRPVLSGVDSAVIPELTAGAIVQATPTVGDTLTVSGSNATGSATFQWQRDTGGGQADISGATSATYDTTGQPEGDYRRGVSDGVQGPVYTAAVTLGAAATVPGTMSAPTVTAVSDTEISVDRAAAPSDGGSAILSYELRWQPDGGSWTIVEMTTDPQTVTGLTASTLYNVQTRAVNAEGPGDWSASGSATTDAPSGAMFTDTFSYTGNLEDQAGWTPVGSGDYGAKPAANGSTASIPPGANATWTLKCETALAADQYAQVTIGEAGSGAGNVLQLILRYTDNDNYYYANVQDRNLKSIYKRIGGTNTRLGSNVTNILSNGDVARFEVEGTTLRLVVNGTTVYTQTNAELTSGYAGAKFERIDSTVTTTTTFDAYSAGDL